MGEEIEMRPLLASASAFADDEVGLLLLGVFVEDGDLGATHILLFVAGDAGPVLVHAHNGRVDHLHRRIMRGGENFHDPVPDTCPPRRMKRL